MRVALTIGVAGCLLALPALAHEPHREAGAHVHGHGSLGIAVEGRRVTMELEVPGADVVGFEHEAKTAEQKKTVEKARTALTKPLLLFKLPAGAKCRVVDNTVEMESGHDDHDHDKAHKPKDGKPVDAGHDHDEDAHHHSEVRATFTLECAAPEQITRIEFDYFKTFPAAQELDVQIVTPKGQYQYDVSRDKPAIDLAGLI